MKIAFLLDNAYGIGGTIRSTVNLSRALADRHTVEVASLRRTAQTPSLPFDSRVSMTHLVDLRGDSRTYDGNDPLYQEPSERFTEGADHLERGIATRLGDRRVERYLRETDADVVIGTRPKVNDYLAAYGSSRYLRIGQEHLTHAIHSEHIRSHQDAAVGHLDAFVTVSYADAAKYRAAIAGSVPTPGEQGGARADRDGTVITCIPNAVPSTDVEPSDGDSKVIVAAGRLIKVKRYDRLLKAFALVSERHPDWRLRLYGRGRQQAALRTLVDRLDLYDRAFLMGPQSPIETEWAKGAIAAVSSDAESFGMTLVEAMHCGVPVVSTDCPYGPGEIITNGQEGLLSPLGTEDLGVRAFADALLHLIEDPGLRRRMSEKALLRAERYAPERIAGEYEELIEALAARRSAGGRSVDAEARAQAQVLEERPLAPGLPLTPARPAKATKSPGATGATKPEKATTSAPSAPSAPTPFHRVLRRRAVRVLRPVLGPLVRRLRDRRQDRQRPGLPNLRRPSARALARADGSLVLRLEAKKLPKSESTLQLRARGSKSTTPVRIPLPPRTEAVDGWVEVRLERSAHRLREARWDTYVVRSLDGSRKRVRADRVETARLLSAPAPTDADGTLTPWVPYTTADGHLAVRAWRRRSHAEVLSTELGPESCTVRARLYGPAAASPDAVRRGQVLAVSRRETEQGFELPVRTPQVTGTADSDDASDGALVFEVPYELPRELDSGDGKGVWDLWFRPYGGSGGEEGAVERVRFARLLGDLADRKKTDVLPPVRLGDSETGVRFYFSLANDLVLSLQPLPAETAARVATSVSVSASAAPADSAADTASVAPASTSTSASARTASATTAAPASGEAAQPPSSSPSASASN